jgi:F-type H+-transporting ATPase subunit gamma
MRERDARGIGSDVVVIGGRGQSFMHRIGANVVSQVAQLGDTPHLDRLIGPVKVLLDAYLAAEIDVVFLCYTRFINSMAQEPVIEQLVPLAPDRMRADRGTHSWDYIYEPDAQSVIDDLLVRYVEALIYHAVAENIASEQSARRMAMKAASDNAGSVIDDLKLIYNKTRQAAITKELAEIVGGAAAV